MDIEWESDKLFDTEPKVNGIMKWSIKDASGATRGMFTVIPRDSGVLVMARVSHDVVLQRLRRGGPLQIRRRRHGLDSSSTRPRPVGRRRARRA